MTLSKSFFLLALAFCAMCVTAVAAAVALSGDEVSEGATEVAAVALLVSAAVLWREAKRDPDAVLTLVSVFLLSTALCVGIYLFNVDGPPGIAPRAACAACAVLAVACGSVTYRRQRTESADFPDVLGTTVSPTSIFETEGVQFTGLMNPGSAGKPHAVSILLQNTFDTLRTVTIRFDAAGSEKYLRFHREHSVELGAAEVSRVVFPVVAPTYPGSYPLYLSIVVRGSGGKRVRLWRAQVATERTRTATTVAMLAVGHVAFGGGIRFTIGPLPDDIWAAELAQPRQESLWQPRIGTVPRVQPVI